MKALRSLKTSESIYPTTTCNIQEDWNFLLPYLRFDVLTTVITRIVVSWDAMPCSLVGRYWRADKSLARATSRCILFYGENILFDASLVLYIHIYK